MLQRGRRLDLDHEPLGAEHRGEFGLEDLDRDLAVVLEVLGEVDRRHAAGAELALDAVAVGQSSGEPGRGIGHSVSSSCRIGDRWGAIKTTRKPASRHYLARKAARSEITESRWELNGGSGAARKARY